MSPADAVVLSHEQREPQHRSRRPFHVWLLWLWLPCNLVLLFNLLTEGAGPFDNSVTYTIVTMIDRRTLGYHYVPKYTTAPERADGGYFALYVNEWHEDGGFGYCVFDAPHWPDGDPGLGDQNPLPPLVRRCEIYAVPPSLVLLLLGTGWAWWCWLFYKDYRRRPSKALGFDLLPPPPAVTAPIGAGAAPHSGH